MAEIVGAFGVPHMPNTPKDVARTGASSEVGRLFLAVREQVEAVNPDVMVIFDTDHFAMWFYDRLPTFAIGVSEVTTGPGTDDWPGLVSYDAVPVHEALARHLHVRGVENGFDFTLTEEFTVDHSIIVPLHFLNADMEALRMRRPMVPIWVNGMAPPFPRARRCFALGQMVRDAIGAWTGGMRVGVIASGAISGDIGGPRAREGQPAAPPDVDWVNQVVGHLGKCEVDDLLNAATQERILQAGNVSGEMLNWITLMGVVGDRRPAFLEAQTSGGNAYAAWRWDR